MTAPERIFARIDTATVYMDGSSPLVARTREFRGSMEYVRADIVGQAIEALRRLRQTARLLQQNSEGCAVNHYGVDFQTHGYPGWLADTLADIEVAETAIARTTGGAE